MAYKILVVEDQTDISNIVMKYLKSEAYECDLAQNGLDALEKFSHEPYDLILLDVMMPGIDGFEVLKEIRNHSEVPVIMLTAKEQEQDRIKGFDLGVDDYVVKPFSPRELMRRIKVMLKRVYGDTNDTYLHVGSLKLFTQSMKLFKGETEIGITSTEFKLLHTFMKNKGAILTREQLIRLSFGFDYDGFDRNIDSHIKRLRQKIETDPKNPEYLVTKYGAGYVFGGEVK
jgi:DNA-binding response OmpR family regulator